MVIYAISNWANGSSLDVNCECIGNAALSLLLINYKIQL